MSWTCRKLGDIESPLRLVLQHLLSASDTPRGEHCNRDVARRRSVMTQSDKLLTNSVILVVLTQQSAAPRRATPSAPQRRSPTVCRTVTAN